MKKKLEADLVSIAHRILQLKNKSDIDQLYLETQKLYEKLTVLKFVEDYFGEPKPTIGQAEVVEKMKAFFETISVPEFQKQTVAIQSETEEKTEITVDPKSNVVVEDTLTTVITETVEESRDENVAEKPMFALDKMEIESIEEVKPENPKKKEVVQISFDDILGANYSEADFVKVSSSDKKQNTNTEKPVEALETPNKTVTNTPQAAVEKAESKTVTLNDKLVKEIQIGLNDRIAFVKHLFGGNNEDYNRVISQLITFDSYTETKSFIDEMVKPDYNNWEGKEDYEHRFMEIIEKKFLSF